MTQNPLTSNLKIRVTRGTAVIHSSPYVYRIMCKMLWFCNFHFAGGGSQINNLTGE